MSLSPPSGGEHDAPIHLISGYPRGIAVFLAVLLGVSSLLAIILAPMSTLVTILTSFMAAGVSLQWLFHTVSAEDKSLVIFPDGEVYCSGLKAVVLRGHLQKRSWCRAQLACIEIRFRWGTERFVIFSTLQRTSEFRRLRVWLRHSRTEVQPIDI